MPSVSQAQHRAMEAAAHGHSTLGIPKNVGEEFTSKDEEPKPQAAGVVFIAPDGEVLLLRRAATEKNYANHWALPGGKADEGEDPETCADRECLEEIGPIPEGAKRLLDRRDTPNGMVFSTYGQDVDEKFQPTLNGEHSGYSWFSTKDLPEPIHPAVKEVLESMSKPAVAQDEAHETDSVGRVHLQRVPITMAAVNPYKGEEIPGYQELGLESERIYHLFRDPEEIKKAAKTSQGVQLLIKHTPVSAADHKPFDIAGCIGTNAEFDDPYLYNDVSIWTQYAIDGVEDETRRELSSSYEYKPVMTPGEYKGTKYDGKMTAIAFNHVSLVVKGRAGPTVAIDEDPFQPVTQEIPMTKKAVPSRTAIRLGAALSVLAMDAAMPKALTGLIGSATAKTFSTKKPALAKAIRVAFDEMGGTVGATPDDVILKVLSLVEGQIGAEPAEMDEMAAAPAAAPVDPNAAPPPAAAAPEEEDELDENGQPIKKKSMDKAMVMDWLKSKGMGEDDISELDGMMGEADDEEAPEMKPEGAQDKKAKDKAMDKKGARDGMVTKEAMDAAIDAVKTTVFKTQRAINEAAEFVRPWVGSLAMDASIESESDVYRKALVGLGVSGAATLHADALKPVLMAQPKPNARRPAPHFANDAARTDSADARFPHMAQRAGA